MQASLPFAIIDELMPGSVFVLFSFLLGDSSSPLVMLPLGVKQHPQPRIFQL